jgi:hypothetical protein
VARMIRVLCYMYQTMNRFDPMRCSV